MDNIFDEVINHKNIISIDLKLTHA